ncbi:class I SAM-dependent DNA methyltransferase [Peribacillus kribbensis]|uniref:class I SAM-dependent DNA methyltransferase n=1 Tax=Peribacillus kribbensis TaxID=356658 RepID=UPI00040961EC|nr:class I SAM-dependent methyltransferase [Peribacillus kribbensis]
MSYGLFAYLYDELMKDAPYSQWVELLQHKAQQYGVAGNKVLDLACGTGEISLRLAKAGYHVTGVDLSEEMLSVAYAKADQEGLQIPFYQQDMAHLDGGEEFQFITIFCDSLNYLRTAEEVWSTFEGVHRQLEEGGLFMFDVHSPFKMEQIFQYSTFARDDEDISYIWNCFPGDEPLSVEHELSFFVLDEATGKYDRFDETHFQRTYPVEMYKNMLDEAGFELLELVYDLDEDKGYDPEAERIAFIAKKK